MGEVWSADGTRIAVETVGDGPPVILVVGTFCDRTTTRPLAELLASEFTVHAYDRRGRGDSGDTPPYSVDRELDDLAAVLAYAGGRPAVYGHSNGAILALRGAAAGLEMSRVAAYEPPWSSGARAAAPDDLGVRVHRLVADAREGEAVEVFMSEAFGLPPQALADLKTTPSWGYLQGFAATLPHEIAVTGGRQVPVEDLALITSPSLVLVGGESEGWARDAAGSVATAVPGAVLRTIDGQSHAVEHAAVAPVLAEFFRSTGTE